jgi:capsular polysaccharide biosynthesis protein
MARRSKPEEGVCSMSQGEQHPYSHEEIELMDYLNILRKRKWLIFIPTFFLTLLVGIISFFLPKRWEVTAIFQPSKFVFQTAQGQFEEVVVTPGSQIASQISEESYNALIAAELNLDIKDFPKLKAENIKDTELVKFAIREKNVEIAKEIAYCLFKHLKSELDKKIDIELFNLDSAIKRNESEKELKKEENSSLSNKLKILEIREKEILTEMKEVRERIRDLEKEQLNSLNKSKKSESESLGLLLYSNEVQQNLRYCNTLNELLSQKKLEQENLNQEVKTNEQQIESLDIQIRNLIEKKGNMDYAKLIKAPTSSLNPISPKKKLIIAVSALLSLFVFTLLAFFLEYLARHKNHPPQSHDAKQL